MTMSVQGYFDYNSTTPMCQPAINALTCALIDFGNPSSKHTRANSIKQGLSHSRQQVAQLINCATHELVFTSGGTEANNWAIKGALSSCGALNKDTTSHIIISAMEHPSILEIAAYLERTFHIEVSRIAPNKAGVITVQSIAAELRPNTRLVSIMLVNNEIGTIQPIQEISEILKEKHIHFHVDAVQAVGKMPINVHDLGVDSLSFAAHKFYGPKGIGGLYIRDGVVIEPLLHGGGQEAGLRGGTEAAPLILAMGAAAEMCNTMQTDFLLKARTQRQSLMQQLSARLPNVYFHGSALDHEQIPYTLSVCIPGIRAEALAALLDQMHGIQVSLGSACSNNKTVSLSHVLMALGISEADIKSTMRVSIGLYTSEQDIQNFAELTAKCVHSLQKISKAVS
jgi:cysteine desulfurase